MVNIKNIDIMELSKIIKTLANSKDFKYNFNKSNKNWQSESAIYDKIIKKNNEFVAEHYEVSIAKFKIFNLYTLIIKDTIKNKVIHVYIAKNYDDADEYISEIANEFENNKFDINNYIK